MPVDAFVQLEGLSSDAVAVCCDLDAHVFNPEHTDPRIVEALRGTHWIDVRELAAFRLAGGARPAGAC